MRVDNVGPRQDGWWFSSFSSLTASGKITWFLQDRVGGPLIDWPQCNNYYGYENCPGCISSALIARLELSLRDGLLFHQINHDFRRPSDECDNFIR